jgi:DNA ligase (NAD+)
VIAAGVAEWSSDPVNAELIDKLGAAGVRLEEGAGDGESSDLFGGAVFVVSGTIEGFTREEAEAAIGERGGKSTGSVSSRTTALIVGESPGASKTSKAIELGIPIIGAETFKRMLVEGLSVLG